MYQKILDILELGHKDDGASFYTNEEKAELIERLFQNEMWEVIEDARLSGYGDGYDEGLYDGMYK